MRLMTFLLVVGVSGCGTRARSGPECSPAICFAITPDGGQCFVAPPSCCDGMTPRCGNVEDSREEIYTLPVRLVTDVDSGSCVQGLAMRCL